jgi:Chromo (CHRromatin Organisation MOdifier) domain
MAADVAENVKQCSVCAKNRIKERKRTSFLKLLPAAEPLEYVSLDILGPLPKTEHENMFLIVITDRFSMLTRTVPLRVISALAVAKDFTTAYHPQTNGQVERYNRTIVNALRGYVLERQNDWDEFTSAITFSYNCKVHSSLGLAPFELVLPRPPPPLSVESSETVSESKPENASLHFLHRLKELQPLAQRRLAEAQARYKAAFDRSVRDKNKDLQPGSWVYLRREVHETGVIPKLDDQVDGPFRVLEAEGRTFVLHKGEERVRVSSDRVTQDPTPLGESSLRSPPSTETVTNPNLTGKPREPQVGNEEPSDQEDETEYVFEKISGVRQEADGSLRYKVRWFGYGRESDTWEPVEHLPASAVRRYHRQTNIPYPK